jgi:hypothetical protein
MANYLDTGDTGRAVSAESDGALYAGIFGNEKYVLESGNKFKAEVQSNNIVKIGDGDAVMYGRHVRIPANDSALVTINNGHSGTNRIDLIVFRYNKNSTGEETVELNVIQGEDSSGAAVEPSTISGDILVGAMQSDFPLYSVELNGINIVNVTPMFSVIPTSWILLNKINELSTRRITHKLLYYNADGTTGTFTLSDSVKNYDYIEIFYNSDVAGHKAPQKSIKLPTSQTVLSGAMLFDMTSFRLSADDSTKMQLMSTVLNVSGKTCKPETSRQINFGSTAAGVAWSTSSTPHHRVYRVVGYNYGN